MRQVDIKIGYMIIAWAVLGVLILIAIFATFQIAGADISWPFT